MPTTLSMPDLYPEAILRNTADFKSLCNELIIQWYLEIFEVLKVFMLA